MTSAVSPNRQHGSIDAHAGINDDLLDLLRAIAEVQDGPGEIDNDVVGALLGWPADIVARRLASAREQLLLWGVCLGRTPTPRFSDVELTVQGQRLVRASVGRAAPTQPLDHS